MRRIRLPSLTIRTPLKLRGASLVEVMVSLALIGTIFVIGSMIWLNVSGPSSPDVLWNTRLSARKMLEEFEQSTISSDTMTVGGLFFDRTETVLNEEHGLYEVKVRVQSSNGEFRGERFRIIKRDEN